MLIKAYGKNIPTTAFSNRFVQGEAFTERIFIELEKMYGEMNLENYDFKIYGKNANGNEITTELTKVTTPNAVTLAWDVDSLFTATAGKMEIEIKGTFNDTENNKTRVIKFAMGQITILPSIITETTETTDDTETSTTP